MDDFELFHTQEEAIAFVKGFEIAVELIDDDHAVCQYPRLIGPNEWRVDFSFYY